LADMMQCVSMDDGDVDWRVCKILFTGGTVNCKYHTGQRTRCYTHAWDCILKRFRLCRLSGPKCVHYVMHSAQTFCND